MIVGIFGGSFNPVHLGHQKIVQKALEGHYVDRVIIVPAYQNPLKTSTPSLPEALRWEMLEKTFESMDRVSLSDFEVKREELSYTHITLEHFQTQLPDAQLVLLLGEDTFHLFHKWSNSEKILSLATILIFPRPCHHPLQKTEIPATLDDRIQMIDCSIPDISATDIRRSTIEEIKQNPVFDREVLPLWERYIRKGD